MFPTTLEGQEMVQLPGTHDVETIRKRLVDALQSAQASEISYDGKELNRFNVSLFRFVSNWNVLVAVDSGELEILPGNPGAVKYRFSMMRMLVIATIMSLAFGFLDSRSDNLGATIASGLFVAAIAWAFLFGGNYLIAKARLAGLVRKAIS